MSAQRFQSRTEEAVRIAERITGAVDTTPIQWVHIPYQDGLAELGSQDLEGDHADEDVVIAHDTLEELLSYEEIDSESELSSPFADNQDSLPYHHDLDEDMPIQRTLLVADEHPVRCPIIS